MGPRTSLGEGLGGIQGVVEDFDVGFMIGTCIGCARGNGVGLDSLGMGLGLGGSLSAVPGGALVVGLGEAASWAWGVEFLL
jgi:hypothetical protein